MSVGAVSRVIGRALLDPEYRALLFDDPPSALAEFTLTPEETQALKRMTFGGFALVEEGLRERIALSLASTGGVASTVAQQIVFKKLENLFD